jgi:hypothetical protein
MCLLHVLKNFVKKKHSVLDKKYTKNVVKSHFVAPKMSFYMLQKMILMEKNMCV